MTTKRHCRGRARDYHRISALDLRRRPYMYRSLIEPQVHHHASGCYQGTQRYVYPTHTVVCRNTTRIQTVARCAHLRGARATMRTARPRNGAAAGWPGNAPSAACSLPSRVQAGVTRQSEVTQVLVCARCYILSSCHMLWLAPATADGSQYRTGLSARTDHRLAILAVIHTLMIPCRFRRFGCLAGETLSCEWTTKPP